MMAKTNGKFLLKLIVFAALLWGIHYYVFFNFFSEISLYLPLWSIYLFNTALVFAVFTFINYIAKKDESKVYNSFLILTILKMGLVIVFLLPLFSGKSENSTIEVSNFFIAYLIFLVFEINALSKFLKNAQTK